MKPARKAMGLGALSLLLGGFAAAGVSERERALREQVGEPLPVLVAARPIDRGAPLGSADLSIRHVPRMWVPAGVLNRPDQVLGMSAAVAIPKGAYISIGSWRDPGAASAAGLAAGERVATVVAFAPPDAIHPGTRVDVVIARSGSGPTIALRAAEVLAVRRPGGDAGSDGQGHAVEVDLRTRIDGALKLAEAAGEAAAIRLLPIGGGG